MDIALLVAAIAIPHWLNVKATLLVSRDAYSERSRKIAQLLFVWLVPLIGAFLVLSVHRREERSPGTFPADKDPGHDFALSSGALRKTTEIVDGD